MQAPAKATVFCECVLLPRECARIRTVVEPVVHAVQQPVENWIISISCRMHLKNLTMYRFAGLEELVRLGLIDDSS
jgi:hypothetical protein